VRKDIVQCHPKVLKIRTFIRHMLLTITAIFVMHKLYTGWPKKESHYQESPLNRIKNRQCGYIFHQFLV